MSNGKLRPVIVSGYSSQRLAANIASELETSVVKVTYKQHTDKEIQTTIESNVRGREVIVVASAAGDPNKQEKETRLLLRAANRSGAKSVTLLLPYMWYGRSDDNWDERNAPALIDTIETLRLHCTNVVVADPHNHGLTREKFLDSGSPVKSCTPVHFSYPFAVQLKDLFNQRVLTPQNLMLAHADAGSTKRISRSFRESLYSVLGIDGNPDQDDWPQGLKDRDKATGKSRVKGFSHSVDGKDVVIFEDMVSTGGTACDLADALKDIGARSVLLFASSGLFTPKAQTPITSSVDRVTQSKLDAVFITDTYDNSLVDPAIDAAIKASPVIHTVETAPYLGLILRALHAEVEEDGHENGNSISAILKGAHPAQVKAGVITPTPLKPLSPLRHLVR